MTPRECMIAALNHQEPETLPYVVSIEGEAQKALDQAMGGTKWRDSFTHFFCGVGFPFPPNVDLGGGKYKDCYGTTWESGNIMHHLSPALPEPTLRGYRWPDIDSAWASTRDRLADALARQPNHYRTAGISFGLFERCWTLRGFTNFLMDMAAEPAFCEDLLDAVMEHQMRMVGHLLTLDIDALFFSDDWGQQTGLIMGPELWRRYIKPRKAKMISQVHKAGKKTMMHCCGSVAEVMPEIIEIGLDCLESLQPEAMDVFELKRLYGKQIALFGGGPAQSLIPMGKPNEIRAFFARLRRELGKGGGYICAASKPIMNGTPIENAIAAVEGIIGRELERG